MIRVVNDNLTETKKTPPLGGAGFGRNQFVDIHCHCLPTVDDGPATMSEALALCEALVDDGITDVIATPHQLGRFNDFNTTAQIREKVSILNKVLRNNDIALTIMPGAEVRIDERICQLLEADKILTLADGGKYILLELPPQIFIDIEPLLVELSSLDIQAILAHPEGHSVLAKQPEILLKWIKHSVHLQVTSASLLGEFGLSAQRTAWYFLNSGWASLVATDSHNLDARRPCMRAAFERISIQLGKTTARLVCVENPLRVLNSQEMLAISLHKHMGAYNDKRMPSNF